MKSSFRLFGVLAVLLPVVLAVLLGFESVQQSLQRVLPSWISRASSPSVALPQGTLIGKVVQDASLPSPVDAWLGIPYALPPVGDLRFTLPQPVPASNQTVVTTEFGARCPGKQLFKIPNSGKVAESEDCLTANVFRPGGTTETSKLPVAVYIHGGAFNRGTSKMHNSASMVSWSEEPFIVVSFNYRIGALGFLNSALTEKEGLLNLGLKDQILLLEWIQENVSKFGGDPDNVTIIGLSAGAHSIGHHIMNINTKKTLFHKGVMESGGPTSRAVHPADSKLHAAQFHELLVEVGCDKAAESEILACLRAVDTHTFQDAQATVFYRYNPSVRWAWQPVIDNEIISRRPLDAWKSGKWNKVPILTGFNHNEGTMYVPKKMSEPAEFSAFFATLLPQLSAEEVAKIVDLYPDPEAYADSPYLESRDMTALALGPQYKRIEAAYGQYAYVCPVRQTAILGSADPAERPPPVFIYHWAQNRSVIAGANHGDQMWYETMDPAFRAVSPSQDELARFFHSYVTSFIIYGDPNVALGSSRGAAEARPRWAPWSEGQETMIFGMGNDEPAGGNEKGVTAQLVKDLWAKEQCDFWWEQSANPED